MNYYRINEDSMYFVDFKVTGMPRFPRRNARYGVKWLKNTSLSAIR